VLFAFSFVFAKVVGELQKLNRKMKGCNLQITWKCERLNDFLTKEFYLASQDFCSNIYNINIYIYSIYIFLKKEGKAHASLVYLSLLISIIILNNYATFVSFSSPSDNSYTYTRTYTYFLTISISINYFL